MRTILSFIILSLILSLGFVSCKNTSKEKKGDLIYIEASGEKGFYFPYFLYLPDGIDTAEVHQIIVEANNSGFVDDDLEAHKEDARKSITGYSLGNYVAHDHLQPLLFPIFPRSETNWQNYVHALDRNTVLLNDSLERVDLQLLSMVDNAKHILAKSGYTIEDKVFMVGFSASGSFANRFSLIHPDRLSGVAAGGLNGILMLPEDSLKGRHLIFPLGVADFDSIFHKPFDSVTFSQLPQYLFMGGKDDNDAVPYHDAYDDYERNLIYDVIGEEMQPLRWTNCEKHYRDMGVNAKIKTYPKFGHVVNTTIRKDVSAFYHEVREMNKSQSNQAD